MLTIFLACFEQLRAVGGMLLACFLFCRHALPRRDGFWRRAALWSVVCLATGFAYVPLEPVLTGLPTVAHGACSSAYWLLIPALVCVGLCRCYESSPGGVLFRTVLGFALEAVAATAVRYLLVMMWMPDLPEGHPAAYILTALGIYAAMYFNAYRVLARPLQRNGSPEDFGSLWPYAFVLLAFTLTLHVTNGISEWVIPAMGDDMALRWQGRLMRYFCVGIRFLVSTAFFTTQYYVYQTNFLQYERDLVDRLLREKGEQYEFTKENIEFIQRKCHDLKRQLRALELAGEDERREVLEETRRAAEFYDATIRTGHEVIDTLLTEKNLLCANRGIRLSCAVSVRDVDRIGTVDLYTMLSNAMDNAIESAERLEKSGMKTIRFAMAQRGEMLCIEVENYYAGAVELRDGLPITSKADAANHGIGVKSIRTLARRYGGDIAIRTENQTFLLQVVIPLSE